MALAAGAGVRPAATVACAGVASPLTWRSASANCAAGGEPIDRGPGQGAGQRVVHRLGHVAGDPHLGNGGDEPLGDDGLGRGAGEGRLSGQHLVQDAGQAVEIGAAVHVGRAGGLLGAHVGRRAHHHAGLGERGVGAQRLADAEVGHHGRPFVQQDVLGLDVPVDHLVAVGVVERGGDLPGDGQRLGQGQLPLALEPLPQRAAFHVGHDVEEEAAGLAGIVDRQDVGVGQAGGELDLAEEPVGADGGREVGAEDFQGDLAVVAEVLGQEHDGHPALAELALEDVAAGEAGGELVLQGGHGEGKDACDYRKVPDWAGASRVGGVGSVRQRPSIAEISLSHLCRRTLCASTGPSAAVAFRLPKPAFHRPLQQRVRRRCFGSQRSRLMGFAREVCCPSCWASPMRIPSGPRM